jgi:hypothetical protein
LITVGNIGKKIVPGHYLLIRWPRVNYMVSKTKKTFYILFITLLGVVGLGLLRSYIFHRVENALTQKLQSLNNNGLKITYDSVYVDWLKNVITIDNLAIQKTDQDTTCKYPEVISAQQIRIDGFGLLSLMFKRKISIESVSIVNPYFVIRKHSALLQGSGDDNKLDLSIGALKLSSVQVELTDSISCNLLAGITTNLDIESLSIKASPGETPKMEMEIFRVDSTRVTLPKSLYTLTAQSASINFSEGKAHVDTVKIVPQYDKNEFAKTRGQQTDRIEGVIPFINLSEFSFHEPDSFSLNIKHADIQFYLKIYRDKHIRRIPHKRSLPIEQLNNLAFGLGIDTLKVIKSYIEYEELPATSSASGQISFDNIAATIINIDNGQTLKHSEMVMHARADFMGRGSLNVTTTFPRNSKENYYTQGSLRNFNMSQLNSVLEPLAKLKVESGTLHQLNFNFAYNDLRSDGELKLDYNDLKLVALKDNSGPPPSDKNEKRQRRKKNKKDQADDPQDNLKTFVINTFVVKKDLDKNVSEEKRTGTILFYRDTSRSIFNYWWKSLQSGIKSAYGLNNATERKDNRENKKKDRRPKT